MNNLDHTHRLSISWWIGDLFVGSFMIFILVFTIIQNFQDLILGLSGYLKLLFLIVMLPPGIYILIFPFFTKVIVNTNRLVYHTPTFILQADWQNLVSISNTQLKNPGKSLVVIPLEGKLVLRDWAKPFRKIFRHNPKDVRISIGWFGNYNGHSLEMDIRDFLFNRSR